VVDMTRAGEVDLGMLAVENSTYGRVADVHSLLPNPGCTSSTRPSSGCMSTFWACRARRVEDVTRGAWPCGDPAAMRGCS
jgi:hypothetical protein